MNDRSTHPEPRADDWLEALLRDGAREQGADYLADDGFTARVMAALPAPVTLPAWRGPALAALWALAGLALAAFLPGAVTQALRETLDALSAHPFTLKEIATVVLGVSAATWVGGLYALRQE